MYVITTIELIFQICKVCCIYNNTITFVFNKPISLPIFSLILNMLQCSASFVRRSFVIAGRGPAYSGPQR